jgi:chromosome partitioning protein
VIAMAGKLIAVANMKGGVGKTTTVVSLAEALAADDANASVLVVDLDPQASASICLAGDKLLLELINKDKTIDALLEERLIKHQRTKLVPKIRKAVSTVYHAGNQLNISLLPCGPDLRYVERQIFYEFTMKGQKIEAIEIELQKLFETEFLPLVHSYDYVVVDCPPGFSFLSDAAIRMSDLVVVPTVPDDISVYGLNVFNNVFWKKNGSHRLPRQLPHVLVTRWIRNVRQHNRVINELEASANTKTPSIRLFETKVQQAAALAAAMSTTEDMAWNQKYPTFNKKYGDVTCVLDQLVKELKGVLHAN